MESLMGSEVRMLSLLYRVLFRDWRISTGQQGRARDDTDLAIRYSLIASSFGESSYASLVNSSLWS